MSEGLARELALFAEALRLPTVGMSQVGDLELLRSLIHQYPAEATRYVDELYGRKQDESRAARERGRAARA